MNIRNIFFFGLAAFFLSPSFAGPEDCPITKDRFVLILGDDVWEGTCQDSGSWPNITISSPKRGVFGTRFSEIKPGTLEWEGVTNAKKCYYEPGLAAFAEAQDIFKRANQTTPADDAILEQAMQSYQKTIDLLSSIKPHAEGYFKNEFIFSEAKKRLDVAEIMVPKINAAINFNIGAAAFEKALLIKSQTEISIAIADLVTSKRHLKIAVDDYAALALKLENDPAQVAEMNLQADRCRQMMKDGEIITKYFEKTTPLFEIPSLKDERKTFVLQSLVDAIGRNEREWRQVRAKVGPPLNDGKLEEILNEQVARRTQADSIIGFREDLANGLQSAAKDQAGIRPAMEREQFEKARETIGGIKRRLNSLETEAFGNQDEISKVATIVDQMSCFEKEINFTERSLSAGRDAELGLRNAENHEELSSAFSEFRNLTNEAANVEDLCADEPWVNHTMTNAAGYVSEISEHMLAAKWIEVDDGWKAPTLGNFQDELNKVSDPDSPASNAFDQANFYHNKVLEILEKDPANTKELDLTNKSANATFLLEHARRLHAAKDYDGAMKKTALVSSYYGDTDQKWPAFIASKKSWLMKNLILVIAVLAGLGLLFFILFLRRFSSKVIEKKQRNKLDALADKRKMDPSKKVGRINGIIGKLEKLESKRKLSKNGKAYAKMAYVDKASSLLRLGKKEEADKAISRAGDFQRVEPEDIMPALSVYHVKKGNTDDEAMEVYAEYLNLPDHLINGKLETEIRQLVSQAPDAAPPPVPVAAENDFTPAPDSAGRFVTSEIDIGDSDDEAPPPPPPPVAPPKTGSIKKKKTKSVIIKRKKS